MNLISCIPGTTAIFDSLLFVIYMGTNRQYGMHNHYVVVSPNVKNGLFFKLWYYRTDFRMQVCAQ